MNIWNCIKDWFVQYVFGGTLSDGTLLPGFNVTQLGMSSEFNILDDAYATTDLQVPINCGDSINGGSFAYINMGDWLSTTATIITLCLLVFMLYLFARWIFKQVAGLMSF